MANETKGITVKIDAGLHAQVREYVEAHNMTMAEFVSQALDNELHPKIQLQEESSMANTRTIAFQVPEDLYQRIKDYLGRHGMTQKQLFLGLIEAELDREQEEHSSVRAEEPAEHNGLDGQEEKTLPDGQGPNPEPEAAEDQGAPSEEAQNFELTM